MLTLEEFGADAIEHHNTVKWEIEEAIAKLSKVNMPEKRAAVVHKVPTRAMYRTGKKIPVSFHGTALMEFVEKDCNYFFPVRPETASRSTKKVYRLYQDKKLKEKYLETLKSYISKISDLNKDVIKATVLEKIRLFAAALKIKKVDIFCRFIYNLKFNKHLPKTCLYSVATEILNNKIYEMEMNVKSEHE